MDKKGQIGFGAIVVSAIAILIGLAFYSTTFAANIGTMTQTRTVTNSTITMPAVSTTAELTACGQRVVTLVSLANATGGEAVPSTNYTISQSAGTDGYLAAKIRTAGQSAYAGRNVNVSCVYEPKGYIAESGSRSIVGIIAIMMALLILVAAIPNLKDKFFDFIRS